MTAIPSGLEGVAAGSTAICTVGAAGNDLHYRGYSIRDLAREASFEEVAYLLIYGQLPSQSELDAYQQTLMHLRDLPGELKNVLELIPAQAHPMDVLRTGCSMLGVLEPEASFEDEYNVANRLLASFPSMLMYWYHFHRSGQRIECQTHELTQAGHLLHLFCQADPKSEWVQALDCSFILYAEHEFNASTFAARVTAATLSDFYSAVTSAIGTLRGPLHGGANEEAMALIECYKTADEARAGLLDKLANKEKIMGFGHRVYKVQDPRSDIIKSWAETLSVGHPHQHYIEVSKAIEAVMKEEKNLFPNLDFYSASAYHFCGLDTSLFTPLFVCSRITGWAAHIIEQRAHNRLIRPTAEYVGPGDKVFEPIAERV